VNTVFLLLATYNRPHIPLNTVRTDYFPHMTERVFRAALSSGSIALPTIRTDPTSKKSPVMVSITDLAAFLDARQKAAKKELEGVAG